MNLSKMTKTGVVVAVALGLCGVGPALAQQAASGDEGLASASLANGEALKAIALLQTELREYPNDPALMINLGIAHAQIGEEAEARAQFEAASASRNVIELDTADGRTTNSRKLAREAIAMLERGDFRPEQAPAGRLTLRDN